MLEQRLDVSLYHPRIYLHALDREAIVITNSCSPPRQKLPTVGQHSLATSNRRAGLVSGCFCSQRVYSVSWFVSAVDVSWLRNELPRERISHGCGRES